MHFKHLIGNKRKPDTYLSDTYCTLRYITLIFFITTNSVQLQLILYILLILKNAD